MSEVLIRINKRTVERTIFGIIIIALLLLYLFKPTGSAAEVKTLTEQVEELTAENAALKAAGATEPEVEEQPEVEETPEEVAEETPEPEETPEEEPEPEPEPEPEETQLSGKITIDWNLREKDGKIDDLTLFVTNEKEDTQEVTFKLYWKGQFSSTVYADGELIVRSGSTKDKLVANNGAFLTERNLPVGGIGSDTTLVYELRDSDGNLIDSIEETI